MANFDQRNQKVDGDQYNAGRDLNILGSFFSDRTLLAQLTLSLAVQWISYPLVFLDFMFLHSPYVCCPIFYPLIVCPHALHSFFVGFQNKNKKIMWMSIFAGLSPILALILFFIMLVLNAFYVVATAPK